MALSLPNQRGRTVMRHDKVRDTGQPKLRKKGRYDCWDRPAHGGLAQLARAFDLHSKGHRFDSDILHLKFMVRSFIFI